MTGIIRLQNCAVCKFAESTSRGNQPSLECRRNPPIGGPVAIQQAPGQIQIQVIAAFPAVQPDNWCGEWKPKIAIENHTAPPQKLVM